MHNRLAAAVVLAVFLAGCAEAPRRPAHPSLRRQLAGMDYAAAREKLLAEGWTATPAAVAPTGGPARDFSAHGFTEVESCTEGEVVCSFGFRKGEGECLHVVVLGEGGRARVERIDRRCF